MAVACFIMLIATFMLTAGSLIDTADFFIARIRVTKPKLAEKRTQMSSYGKMKWVMTEVFKMKSVTELLYH